MRLTRGEGPGDEATITIGPSLLQVFSCCLVWFIYYVYPIYSINYFVCLLITYFVYSVNYFVCLLITTRTNQSREYNINHSGSL